MKDGKRDVLVIDIGGTFIKLYSDGDTPEKFESSRELTPRQLVRRAKEVTKEWEYDAVSIGYPGRVDHNGPTAEPGNLGDGWVRFDFEKAFECPVRMVNDAALQALGAYDDGRMLFLGLGTGLGSAMIADHVIVPMELGCLPFRDTTMAGFLGKAGLEQFGEAAWRKPSKKSPANSAAPSLLTTLSLAAAMSSGSKRSRPIAERVATTTLTPAATGCGRKKSNTTTAPPRRSGASSAELFTPRHSATYRQAWLTAFSQPTLMARSLTTASSTNRPWPPCAA
ncbi:MAG: ROK family protein [Tepidisphaeraceae bacterium]